MDSRELKRNDDSSDAITRAKWFHPLRREAMSGMLGDADLLSLMASRHGYDGITQAQLSEARSAWQRMPPAPLASQRMPAALLASEDEQPDLHMGDSSEEEFDYSAPDMPGVSRGRGKAKAEEMRPTSAPLLKAREPYIPSPEHAAKMRAAEKLYYDETKAKHDTAISRITDRMEARWAREAQRLGADEDEDLDTVDSLRRAEAKGGGYKRPRAKRAPTKRARNKRARNKRARTKKARTKKARTKRARKKRARTKGKKRYS
jgi:hypothetical protein